MSDPNHGLQQSLAQDLREAQKMSETLEWYLLQDELYTPMGISQPRMTLGGLLLRSRRLRFFHQQLNAQQRSTLQEINQVHSELLKKWREHYERKLQAEVVSRLQVIAFYLDECEESRDECAANYGPEAQRRTIVQELLAVSQQLDVAARATLEQEASQVDMRLRQHVEQAVFLWDTALQPVYPEPTFWWLYRQPVSSWAPMR